MFDLLTSPFPLLGLKNRLVMPPMTRCQCDGKGSPTEALGRYYIERAKANVGLIIIESCAVNNSDARGYLNGCQLNQELHTEAWRPIVQAIQAYGAKVWVQIFHAGRLTVKEICETTPLAPSAIKPLGRPSFWSPEVNGELVHFQTQTPYVEPLPMSDTDIERIVLDFQNAARLAADAGFDGVEIHGAHGYLLHEFVSKFANKRDDTFSLDNGIKFCRQVVESCKQVLDPDMVLSYRISTHMIDNNYLGLKDLELEVMVPTLVGAGVDVFHSSELQAGQPAFRSKHSLGASLRGLTDKPIIGCGNLHSMIDGEDLLATQAYDLAAFGRTLLLDKQIPRDDNGRRFSYQEHFSIL